MIVTPLYAGLLGVFFLMLSLRVIQFRQRGISLGDGGDPIMLRRIRAHGNFSEYVPLALLMMGFLSNSGVRPFICCTRWASHCWCRASCTATP